MNNNELPWSFLSGTYQLANKAVGTILAESDPLSQGFIGVMRDSSVVFLTAGGAVNLRILHRSGGSTVFTADFSATATGLSAIMSGEGSKLQVVVATQNASGVIDVNLHGIIQLNSNTEIIKQRALEQPILEGGL